MSKIPDDQWGPDGGPWSYEQIRAVAADEQDETEYSGHQMVGAMLDQVLDLVQNVAANAGTPERAMAAAERCLRWVAGGDTP